jgi:hypothetical protein
MKMDSRSVYPCAVMMLCMGSAELHSRFLTANEKMAEAVQSAVSLSTGYDAWVGNRAVNAYEYIGQTDSVIDIYNSFVGNYTRGSPDRILRFRARTLYDAGSIESYKVFYLYPVLLLPEANARKRIRRGVPIPSEVASSLEKRIRETCRVEDSLCHVVPVVLHRSKVAQAIESHFAQSIVAILKQGEPSSNELPSPVDPYFKLSSEWPDSFPVPTYDSQGTVLSSHVHLPDQYKTPATLEVLQKKGWTVALS